MKRKLSSGIVLAEIVIAVGLAAACIVLFCGWAGEVIVNQRSVMTGLSADLERIAGVSWFVTQLKECSQDAATWVAQGPERITYKKNGAIMSFEINKGRLMRYQRSTSLRADGLQLIEDPSRTTNRKARKRTSAAVILKNVDRMVARFWLEQTAGKRLPDRSERQMQRVTGVSVELHMQDGHHVCIDAAFRSGERVW